MALELFAQTNPQQDYKNGVMVGMAIAVVLCSSIPLVAGLKKNQPVLGIVGAVCSGAGALLLGCLLGLPVAGVFVVIINLVGKSNNDSLSRRREEDELEAYRRRRERGVIEDDEDDEDDYDDEPRSRRRRNYD